MNKRIRKKLEKRAGCMHYNDARRELLIRAIKRLNPEVEMIVFTTSKSGRAIIDITTYCDIIPTSVSVGGSSNE
jgi:hypothetical protein